MGFINKDKFLRDRQGPNKELTESTLLTTLLNFTESIEERNYDEVNHIIANMNDSMTDVQGFEEILKRLTNVIQCRENHYKTRLQLIIKALEVGLWEMDVHQGDPIHPDNEVRWSEEFRTMLGYYDENDFPNRLDNWSKLLHPDEEEQVLEKFIDHLLDNTGSTKYDVEYRLLTAYGKYKWFRDTGTTIRDQQGNPIMIVGALFDINERKKKEEELIQLVNRAKLINKVTNEASWELKISSPNPLDPKKEIWWSDRFRNLLGFKDVHDFPGLVSSWLNIIHPEDYVRAVKAVEDHLSDLTGNTKYDITYRLRTKKGDYRWFHVKGYSKRNEDGIPVIMAGTIQDVTRDANKENVIELIKVHMDELLNDVSLL